MLAAMPSNSQLLPAYEVISTSSPRNFDYVRQLGANQVFDYNSSTVRNDVIKAFEGKTSAGAFAVGAGSADACLEIVRACKGNRVRPPWLASPFPFTKWQRERASPPRSCGSHPKLVSFQHCQDMEVSYAARHAATSSSLQRLRTMRSAEYIYVDFLPRALAEGRYVAAPEPFVVGKGLDSIQAGFRCPDWRRVGSQDSCFALKLVQTKWKLATCFADDTED